MTTINVPLTAAAGTHLSRSATATGKIAIVGPGHVGVTLAYACLIRGTGRTIALYGRNAEKVRAEVADLAHGLQFVPMATVTGPGLPGRVGTITRTDGSRQLTYNGHPLYTDIGDSAPGQARGNNLNLNGAGLWREVRV